MKKLWMVRIVVAACVMASSVVVAQEIPWGEEAPKRNLPAIFRGRAKDRLAAEEVALQDAYRKLIERIYGLSLDAKTDLYDMLLESRRVDAAFRNEIKGMKEAGKRYYDDGRVEIAVQVTLREVVEIITKSFERVKRGDALVSEKALEDIERVNRDKVIMVVGRGALKGSKGLDRIRAMRAAEVDGYARIAARVFALKMEGGTTVRDFTLASDKVRSKVAVALLNGVKFTKYTFDEEDACEAVGELTLREVVEVLTRIRRRHTEGSKVTVEEIESLERQNKDTVIRETGKGTVRQGAVMPAQKLDETFEEQKTIIRRVIEKGVVVTE
jgi:hypothetical protein